MVVMPKPSNKYVRLYLRAHPSDAVRLEQTSRSSLSAPSA